MKKIYFFLIPIALVFYLVASGQQIKVKIVPLGKVSDASIVASVSMIKKYIGDVVVLPKEEMPKEAYYKPRKRYRADRLIKWLHDRAGFNEVYIGLTEMDISHSNKKQVDFGIMGLAIEPGKGCVASSSRVKDKVHFPKVVIHELGHTTGLSHCPNQGCYMMAAKGKDHTAMLTDFCMRCKKHLRSKNWNIQ